MRHLFIPAISVILTACAVGPRYVSAPVVVAAQDWSAPATTTAVEPRWWAALADPTLSELVSAALEHNADLRSAAAQMREARETRAAVWGAGIPQVVAGATAGRNELSTNGEFPINSIPGFKRRFNLFDAGFDASWELDFWGRTTHAVAAADARVAAAVEAGRAVQVQMIAEVVRNYVDLRSAQERLASARADVATRVQATLIQEQRWRAGEIARSEAVHAAEQEAVARSAVPALDADVHAAAAALSVLTGQPPEALSSLVGAAAALPASPPAAGVGLRSELLRRRPDVREVERELAAATADEGVATADLFPRVTLGAAVGQQARDTGNLFTPGSARYQFGPSLSWPVFSAGRLHAQLRAAKARTERAAAAYEKAVLNAFADSETALNRYAAARESRHARDQARLAAAQLQSLAEQRHTAGEDDLLSTLDAQSEYHAAEAAASRAHADELTALAMLYKALGGGWEDTGERVAGARR